MSEETYIQIGETALRDPVTGAFLPSVPLYIKADDSAIAGEEQLIQDIGRVLAGKFKQYMDGCAKAGVAL